jgi:hypothetical protein
VAALQLVLDELIQAVEVDVGEELAVEVADGQTLIRSGAEQGFVRRDAGEEFRIALEQVVLVGHLLC